jgi:lambda family phage portal protein
MNEEGPTRFDRLISYIAPGYALKRYSAHLMFKALSGPNTGERSFDAVNNSRLRGDWTNITQDADASLGVNGQALRNMVRDLSHRSGLVAGPLRRITNNVIGLGIRPQSRVKEDGKFDTPMGSEKITTETAERFNYQAEKNYRKWGKKAASDLRATIEELQALAFRAMIGDGESLIVLRSSDRQDRIIPLAIEVIEIDRLSTPPKEINNPKVRNGIRFDDEGAPELYYVAKRHPGSTNIQSITNINEYEEIAAYGSNGLKKVLHLFDILRPGQSRGYTPFAAGLGDMQDLARYREAVIVAARVGACLAAFIERPNAYNSVQQNPSNVNGQLITKFEPGMVRYMNPGEKVTPFTPSQPQTQFGEFTKQILLTAANAIDIPYEVFANDWAGLNYSNARTVLLQAYLAFRIYQRYIINHLCIPIWESFISDCVIKSVIDAPGFGTRKEDYFDVSWVPPGWQWVDPLKESQAAANDIDNLITTLSDTLAGRGDDWEEKLDQRARELKRIKELEETYEIKLRPEKTAAVSASDGNDNTGGKKDEE